MTKELAATVTKFISENQTHTPGQSISAPAATPSPAQPAKRWGQQPCNPARGCCRHQGLRKSMSQALLASGGVACWALERDIPVTMLQAAV